MIARILHASDLQVGKPYLPEVGDALVELSDRMSPDLVVVSGDLTQRAKEREYLAARSLLDRFRPLPVVTVPGNHDVPLYRAWERLICPWRKWRRHIGPVRSVLRLPAREGAEVGHPSAASLVVVSLPTAAPRRAIVNGRLAASDLTFAERAFDEAGPMPIRVLVIHHLLVPVPGQVKIGQLPHSEAVRERIAAMGVRLVLAGHAHSGFHTKIGETGPCHLIHAGTATSSRHRHPEAETNSVNVVDVGRGGDVSVRRCTLQRGRGAASFVAHGARRLLVGLFATLSATVLAHAAASAQRTTVPEVADVRFEGNAAFPGDSLARAIHTTASECRSFLLAPFCWADADFATRRASLSERALPNDVARLRAWYYQRGYREAEAEVATFASADGRIRVVFTVSEGRPVLLNSLAVTGIDSVVGPVVWDDLAPASAEPLNLATLEATRDSIQTRLANLGYAYARVLRHVEILFADPYAARVTFEVTPGPRVYYGAITVTGNVAFEEGTILNTAQLAEGDLYSLEAMREARVRLFGLDLVRRADIVLTGGGVPVPSADAVVPVSISITEGDAYRLLYGAGLNGAECVDVEARWTARNFLGGGRLLRARTRVANLLARQVGDVLCPQGGSGEFAALNWLASLDFTQPWVYSTRNSFSGSLFGERQSLPDVFVRRAVGARMGLTRTFGPKTALTVAYGVELSTLDAAEVLFCTGLLICTPDDISIFSQSRRLAPVNLRLSRNLATSVLSPTSGHALALDYERAVSWTGSEFGYHRIVGEGTWYGSIADGVVLASRARIGWVTADHSPELGSQDAFDVHPAKRFFAGGANSVRGFAQGRLGPRVLHVADVATVMSRDGAGCAPRSVVDLSCDASSLGSSGFVPRPTGGERVIEVSAETRIRISNAFEDAGQVWGNEATPEFGDLEVTPGMGVRYFSPVGPVRLDLAYNFRAGERLPVVVPGIRRYLVDADDPADRLTVSGSPVPWVATNSLAVLTNRVLYGEADALSLDRLRLHVSIGQAF